MKRGIVPIILLLFLGVVVLDFSNQLLTGRDVVAAEDDRVTSSRSDRSGIRNSRIIQTMDDTSKDFQASETDLPSPTSPFATNNFYENSQAVEQLNDFFKDQNMPSSHSTLPLNIRPFTDTERQLALEEVETAIEKDSVAKVIIWPREAFASQTDKTAEDLLQDLSEKEFKKKTKGNSFVAGEISASGFEKIKNRDLVIMPDVEIFTSLAESRPLVKADQVETRGITGRNIAVCVVDTGVDYTHPNLGGCTSQQFLAGQCTKVVGGYDFCSQNNCGQDPDPMDEDGHGTHVAGIVTSTHITIRGIATGSNIVAAKVFGGGFSTISTVGAAIDWCTNNAARYNVKVITMSLGTGVAYSSLTCPHTLAPSIQNALRSGIAVVAAAGNRGQIAGVEYPACENGVISVGATYDANIGARSCDPTTRADQITCFSNRGENLDLLAPGSVTTSTASSAGYVCGAPNGGFADCSGTSMATPHVAGAAALLLQQNSLRPAQIENILEYSGVRITDPSSRLTFSRIDTLAALDAIRSPLLSIDGTPRIGNTLYLPLSDVPSPGKIYLLMYSTATSPGITLPDNRVIPLAPNSVFFLTLTNPQEMGLQNNLGIFDSYGFAEARFTIPSFVPPNLQLYFAFITLDLSLPFPQNIVSISPAVSITTLPFNPVLIKNAVLPTPRDSLSCTEHIMNNKIYCFAGLDDVGNYYNNILEYNTISDTLIVKNAQFPTRRYSLSCAQLTGTHKSYCFGGIDTNGYVNQIIEYNSQNDILTIKNAVLPQGREALSCASSSVTNNIYCFGGFYYPNILTEILRYTPSTDTIQLESSLPSPRRHLSCVESSVNQKIYCFGGDDGSISYDSIIEYDPSSSRPSPVLKNARFPSGLTRLSCVDHRLTRKIYCFGGTDANNQGSDKIFVYDPLTDTLVQKTDAFLPSPRSLLACTSYASTNKLYCFGGSYNRGYLDQILEYTPP